MLLYYYACASVYQFRKKHTHFLAREGMTISRSKQPPVRPPKHIRNRDFKDVAILKIPCNCV